MEWWRPPYVMGASTISQSDPVQHIVFTFYEDQLFRLVINYDPERTDGLTDDDMIEALSAMYGLALLQPSSKNIAAPTSSLLGEMGAPIAQWADADYSVGKPFTRQQIVQAVRTVLARKAGIELEPLPAPPPPRVDARTRIAAELARTGFLAR